MRSIVFAAWLVCAGFPASARADDGQSVPLGGQSDSLDAVAAALDHPSGGDRLWAEAERRLRADGDASALAAGSLATSLGATMLVTGIVFASNADWGAVDCPRCIPAVMLSIGGAQLLFAGLVNFLTYGSSHAGRHHASHVRALIRAMDHASPDAASAARRGRLALGWSLFATGTVLLAGAVTLFAIGPRPGFDEDARLAFGGASALVGSWLTTLGGDELATKWTPELAFAPVRAGAVFTWSRSW